MPYHAEPLTVHTQAGEPHLWAKVDPSQDKRTRCFHVIPTGMDFDDAGKTHLGTFLLNNGSLVFHVFEELQ